MELWQLQSWCTGVAAVLRCAISVSTQVVLYIFCHVTMVILMAWRGIVVDPELMHWRCCSLAMCHQCQYTSCTIQMSLYYHGHTDGLARHCGSSSAVALELLQSCAVPSVSVRCFIHMLPCYHGHVDGLAWNCGRSSTDTLELLQSCAVPSMSVRKLLYTYVAMLEWSYWWLGVEMW